MSRTFEVYLRKRPPMLELSNWMSNFPGLSICLTKGTDNLFLFEDHNSDSANGLNVTVVAPVRIDPFGDIPHLNSRCLAHCSWRIAIYATETLKSLDLALRLGEGLVGDYEGGLYDSDLQQLIYPEKAHLYKEKLDWPPWNELRRAFSCDCEWLEIYVPRLLPDKQWPALLSEAVKCGFKVQQVTFESTGNTVQRALHEISISHDMNSLDSMNPTVCLQMESNGVFLTCWIHEATEARIDLEPSKIVVFRDAVVILELMQALAARLKAAAYLIPEDGGVDESIISVTEFGVLSFHNQKWSTI